MVAVIKESIHPELPAGAVRAITTGQLTAEQKARGTHITGPVPGSRIHRCRTQAPHGAGAVIDPFSKATENPQQTCSGSAEPRPGSGACQMYSRGDRQSRQHKPEGQVMSFTLTRSATGFALLAVLAAGCGTAAAAHHAAANPKPAATAPATAPAAPPPAAKAHHHHHHHHHSRPAPPVAATPPAPPASTAPAPPANPIPQGNGGDQDADNNGGPSDGDGNI
jgi:hypothetical protein